MTPTLAQHNGCQALYDYFNAALWDGRLPQCMLNFERKSKALGFFAPERWTDAETADEGDVHEISLNPEHMSRPFRDVCGTLVHEMCHLWQREFGTKYPKRPCHNREFATEMERVGLITSTTGEPGGARTGAKMTHYIDPQGAFARVFAALPEDIALPWRSIARRAEAKKKDKSKVKFTCQTCGQNAWAKVGAVLSCGACDQPMATEDSDDGDD